MDDELHDYVVAHSTLPDSTLPALASRTAELGDAARMQIGADAGAMLTALTHIVRARFAVEVGTFTGYSSICIARGLPAGGRLLCCDVSDEWTSIAREAWRTAGVDDRIELRIAPAAETVASIEGPIDLAFVDADKSSYDTYLDLLLPKLSDHGVIAVDNVLWGGSVAREGTEDDPDRQALVEFNDRTAERDDCDVAMLTIGDGISLITKRS